MSESFPQVHGSCSSGAMAPQRLHQLQALLVLLLSFALILVNAPAERLQLHEEPAELSTRGTLLAIGGLRLNDSRRITLSSSSESSSSSFGRVHGVELLQQQGRDQNQVQMYAAQAVDDAMLLHTSLDAIASRARRLSNAQVFPLPGDVHPPKALGLSHIRGSKDDDEDVLLTVVPANPPDAVTISLPVNEALEISPDARLQNVSASHIPCGEGNSIDAMAWLNAKRAVFACSQAKAGDLELDIVTFDTVPSTDGKFGVSESMQVHLPNGLRGADGARRDRAVDMSMLPAPASALVLLAAGKDSDGGHTMQVRLLTVPALEAFARETSSNLTRGDVKSCLPTLVGQISETKEKQFSFNAFSSIAAYAPNGNDGLVHVALFTDEPESTTMLDLALGECTLEELSEVPSIESPFSEDKPRCRSDGLRPQCIADALRNEGEDTRYKPRVSYVGTLSADPALTWPLYIFTLLGSVTVLVVWFGWDRIKAKLFPSNPYADLDRATP